MDIQTIHRDKLEQLESALDYVPRHDLFNAVMWYGPYTIPVINRNTFKVLNHAYTQALVKWAKLHGLEEIPCLLIKTPARWDGAVTMALNGGFDEWLMVDFPPESVTESILSTITREKPGIVEALAPYNYVHDYIEALAGINGQEADTKRTQPRQLPIEAAPIPDKETLDIPILDLDLQILKVEDFTAWNSRARSDKWPFYHFYVDDRRFYAVINEPEKVIEAGATHCIELNISSNPHKPGALVLADIWRKRKVSQIWQQAGIRVAVDLNVTDRWQDANLLGVPKGWRSYANRADLSVSEHLEEDYHRACLHAGTENILYMVCGAKQVRDICERNGWHWIPDSVTERAL